MHDDLMNAPPRLSDLRGDELREALFRRHEANKQHWLQVRKPKGLLSRLFGAAA